jgi:hypothetical protein
VGEDCAFGAGHHGRRRAPAFAQYYSSYTGAPGAKLFSKLEAAPKDGVPVMKWADPDEAFTNVAQAIRAAVAEGDPLIRTLVRREIQFLLVNYLWIR